MAKVHGISLCVDDSKVSPVKSAKNLGTWIDSNLNLKVNVNNMCKAAYHHLTNVRRIRKYLDEKASQTLIYALVIGGIGVSVKRGVGVRGRDRGRGRGTFLCIF